MKPIKYIHGESSFTVYLKPSEENLYKLDKLFLEENGYCVLQEIDNEYKKNIGLFTTIPATNDWGTVYIDEKAIILTFNKLHPKYEEIKNKILD